jgi:hypothetical protein
MKLDDCINKFLSEAVVVESKDPLKNSDIDKLQKLATEFMALGDSLQKQAASIGWQSTPVSSQDEDNLRSLHKAFNTLVGGYSGPTIWVRDVEDTIKRIETKRMKSGGAPTIERSASQLQLYASQPGSNRAAKDISSAMTKAVKVIFGYMEKNPDYNESKLSRELGKVYKSTVDPVMEKHADSGAQDSEARHAVQQTLINQVKTYYGISGFTDLADYMS